MEQDEIKKRVDFWNGVQDKFKIEMLDGEYELLDYNHRKIKNFKICSDEEIFKLIFDEIFKMGERRENYRIRSMFDQVKRIQNGWGETE